MSSTLDNLRAAFAGESQANRRYLAFAEIADEEGLTEVAKRFRVAATSETVHALVHLATMGEVDTTEENLRAAIKGESHEHQIMYPEFIEQANAEGNAAAVNAFHAANEAEKFHDAMFCEALSNLADVPVKQYFVCEVCGMTYENEAPGHCIICNAPKSQIKEVV
jgi:rubrerythrin